MYNFKGTERLLCGVFENHQSLPFFISTCYYIKRKKGKENQKELWYFFTAHACILYRILILTYILSHIYGAWALLADIVQYLLYCMPFIFHCLSTSQLTIFVWQLCVQFFKRHDERWTQKDWEKWVNIDIKQHQTDFISFDVSYNDDAIALLCCMPHIFSYIFYVFFQLNLSSGMTPCWTFGRSSASTWFWLKHSLWTLLVLSNGGKNSGKLNSFNKYLLLVTECVRL